MVRSILSYGMAGGAEWLIILIITGLPIFLLIRFIIHSSKEKKRLRLEVGKLADEVRQLKEQMKDKQS